MSKIDLDPITSGYNLSKINSNFQKVEDTLNQEVLYRKNYVGELNEMRTNLDMNGNKILNVTTGTSDGSLVTKGYVDQGLALKFDKSGGPMSGSVDMSSNEIINVSRLSTNTLEIGGVQVVPTSLVIDPYNGTREALRRSYAEAGYNLVDGSFEAGGKLVNANDVLLQERTGKAFSGPAGNVPAGTNPVGVQWTPRSNVTLRSELSAQQGATLVKTSDGRTVEQRLAALPNKVDAAGTAAALISQHNSSSAAHPELSAFISSEADRAESAAESIKPYVDSALSDLSTAANKFYPTLAGANADIANINVNQPVTVGEAVNGGLWYKATAGATSLTKSPYDPLNQSKDYTDQLFKKYFNVVTNDPEFLLVITDNEGNRLLAIDRSGYTHLNLTQEYADTVKPSDTTYQSLVSLLSLMGNVTTDPENLFVVSDASKNTLLKIDRDGMISGNFNISYSDLLNTSQAPLQLGLEDSSSVSNPYLFKISDYSGNILFAIFKDGTVDIPYLSSSSLQVDTINSVLSSLEQNTTAKLTTKTKVNVSRQGYMRLKVEALNFPTDKTGQVGTKGTVLFCNPAETEQYLKCNVEMFVQGASTVNDLKKGYTFDLYNSNNEELGVKFGDMISSSSFHLKAFYRDPTHTRDQAGYRFWKSLAETLDYPYCKINNSVYAQSTTRSDKAEFTFDAKYYPHGFPVEIYLNDTFHGLYTFRLKKTRENYALNSADLNHIFLDNAEYRARLNTSFNYAQWEIKSPKMQGYSDQGPIPSTFPTVQAAIDSLFNFTKGLSANYANHATVLNLPHWVLFYILAELTGHWDIDGNNYNIFTWDGAHWSILPYDMDLTLNWHRNSGATQTGFLINVDIWQTFRTVYSNEIKTMWTKFRNEKSITIEKVVNTYRTVAKDIPREVYVADKAKWGLATDFTGNDYPNIEQIYRYIAARIDYLDSQWLV